MGPTNNIGYMMMHLAKVFATQNDQALQDRLGIGFSSFKILMMLQHSLSMQQRQIAELLGQTEASISRQIKGLVDDGLLSSKVSAQNRREHLTSLTPKGERVVEEALQTLNETHAEMFAALSEQQREQLLSALNTMHRYACQDGKVGVHHKHFNE
jgi:DNA-binding MarR family transcriptional regulator